MGGSSSKSGSPTVENESDDNRRRAKVYILKTTIGTGEEMNPIVNHWALVFKFNSGTYPWVIIDGTNVDGKLRGNYRSQSSEPSGTLIDPKGGEGFFTFLEAIFTLNLKQFLTSLVIPEYVDMSPSEIRQFALDHPLNGETYILYFYDCQMWVTNAAIRLESA